MELLIIFALGLAGLCAGLGCWYLFRRLPTKWLLDYGETVISDSLRQQQLLPVWPDAVLLACGQILLFSLSFHYLGFSAEWGLVLLASQPLVIILVADQKTRIIPDQMLLALIPCAGLIWLHESLIRSTGWLAGLGYRLAAGFSGAFFLWFCGWLAQKIMRREAMGMGDVKLLFVAGLLVGLRQLPMLVILSFISAAFLALPLLIRRMRNPDTDTEMAFGPFIALATILVLGFSRPLSQLWQLYLDLLAG